MSKLLRVAGGAALAAGAYALAEPFTYRLRTHDLALAPGSPGVDVLHVSDTHLRPLDAPLLRFVASLPERLGAEPDLVLVTGDLIESDASIDPIVEALGSLPARIGRYYVLGSHDYYIATRPSYLRHFTGDRKVRNARRADTQRLEDGLQSRGFVPLTNAAARAEAGGATILLAGVDDPYLDRQTTAHISRRAQDRLAIGLVHAPDVVSEWALNGFDLVVAGHTHAGQVRVPGMGALVTNCTLPAALAGGLHRVGSAWLHVSPGLGTGRFSPIRFGARPEATLLRLRPEPA